MTEQINGGGSRGYNTTIPSLSDNADIVTALKTYHYGNATDGAAVEAASIAGYLATKVDNTLIDNKGDLLVGTANNTVAKLAVGTNGYWLVADSSQTSGLKWENTDYNENHVRYIMGYYT